MGRGVDANETRRGRPELARGADLRQSTLLEHREKAAQSKRFSRVVRDVKTVNRAREGSRKRTELTLQSDVRLASGSSAYGRGIENQGPRNRDALPFPARELVGMPALFSAHTDPFQHRGDLGVAVSRVDLLRVEPKRKVPGDGQVRPERKVLENDGQVAFLGSHEKPRSARDLSRADADHAMAR
jgi:hypothetical protein